MDGNSSSGPLDNHLQARFYSSSCPTGKAIELAISGSEIEIFTLDNCRFIPKVLLDLRTVGMDEQGLEVSWRDGEDSFAIQVNSKKDTLQLLSWLRHYPVEKQISQLSNKKRSHNSKRAIAYSVLFVFIAFPFLLVLLAWTFNDSLAEWIANKIPLEQEVRLGEMTKSQLPFDQYIQKSDDWFYVMDLFNQLTPEDSDYYYEVYISPETSINAFAIPGGTIVVHQGLIEQTRRYPAQLAGVLAHEIQHVELKHGLKALVKQAGFGAMISVALGDLSGSLALMSHQFLQLSFSRSAESEADREAVKQLIDAGIDPRGMIEFFQVLEERHGNTFEWLSTHPNHDTRIRDIEELLKNINL